jgi:hypothetical protein
MTQAEQLAWMSTPSAWASRTDDPGLYTLNRHLRDRGTTGVAEPGGARMAIRPQRPDLEDRDQVTGPL